MKASKTPVRKHATKTITAPSRANEALREKLKEFRGAHIKALTDKIEEHGIGKCVLLRFSDSEIDVLKVLAQHYTGGDLARYVMGWMEHAAECDLEGLRIDLGKGALQQEDARNVDVPILLPTELLTRVNARLQRDPGLDFSQYIRNLVHRDLKSA